MDDKRIYNQQNLEAAIQSYKLIVIRKKKDGVKKLRVSELTFNSTVEE